MEERTVNIFAPTTPHAKQREVLSALDEGTRFVLLRAGRKWRKTSLMVSWLFEKAFETGLTCPYVAPNRVQAKNIAWDDHVKRVLNELRIKGVPYKKNEVELSIKLPNGGKVQLLGIENQEALRGISNWGAFAGDEIDDWEQDIWPTIIRPNLMVHKAPAIMGGTPKGFRHMYALETSGLFKAFHYPSNDNPELDPTELAEMIEEYKRMGESYYRQEILAEYEKPVGVVYAEWDMIKNFRDVPYDPLLPLHVTFDFGVNDPTAIIWIQPFGAEHRVIDYYEASNANVEHFVSIIRAKSYKTPDLYTGDPAGNARTMTTGTSPIEEYAKFGIHILSKAGVKIPEQIRITHKFIPSLFIDKTKAVRLRDCLLNYKYPDKKETVLNQSNEIPIHDEFSHGMRALEYYFTNFDQTTSNKVIETVRTHNLEAKRRWAI